MNSAELERFMWRDPAKAYEITEARTCQGCAWVTQNKAFGITVMGCGKGRSYGVKCKFYSEVGGGVLR